LATAQIPEVLLHKLFERSAAENADKIALIARDAALTYRELNEKANIVANNLIARGIRTGDSVALLLPRESCFFACLFGICNYLMPHPANTHMYYIKESTSVYLSVTTVSFDMSFKEHTAALCNGKTLVFAAEDEMNDPRALAQLMERYDVDCFNATPSRPGRNLKTSLEKTAPTGRVFSSRFSAEPIPVTRRNDRRFALKN